MPNTDKQNKFIPLGPNGRLSMLRGRVWFRVAQSFHNFKAAERNMGEATKAPDSPHCNSLRFFQPDALRIPKSTCAITLLHLLRLRM